MRIIKAIKDILHIRRTFEQTAAFYVNDAKTTINCRIDNIEHIIHYKYLVDKAIHSSDTGVSNEMYCNHEVIVSLTSYGRRIHNVAIAIESIMQGTIKPNRIILWLSEDEFNGKTLPILLQNQQKRGLQIEYCKDLKSYKKIVPAIIKYPDSCIVTIDDDLIYECDLLEHLLGSYLQNPACVSACRTHVMRTDGQGKLLEYLKWGYEQHETSVPNMNFLTSGGGTLFPPGCFPVVFFDDQIFMSICPTADDVWINAMLRYKDVNIVKAYTHHMSGNDFFPIHNEYEQPLWKTNNNLEKSQNDIQIEAVFSKYGIFSKL